jgi:dTDP-4-amino-4,6-dideoxy-D-galactose acyltransferase
MESIEQLVFSQHERLCFYSPYNFIRSITPEKQIEVCILPEINTLLKNALSIEIKGEKHLFFVEPLIWDSKYFGIATIKLRFVLYQHQKETILTEAIEQFKEHIAKEFKYCFIEVPSEDLLLMQCLGRACFKLVETRLTYFANCEKELNHPRYEIRVATANDTSNLMRVAREMRNKFDRFHADPIFSTNIADEFLATYIEQSLNGFADVVLTPAGSETPSDSFLTARYLKHIWPTLGVNVSKMILSAVSSNTNKGWYKKLISEMTYLLKQEGAQFIYMNTQSTNRAVISTWENLGYRFGCTSHIFSFNT